MSPLVMTVPSAVVKVAAAEALSDILVFDEVCLVCG
jgi:hypothetical protein